MTTRTVWLSLVDAWFFRDGRPYNEKETNQTDVASQFPPSATSVVGAIRAGLARGRGWNGSGHWDAGLNTVLGDGFDNLGTLRFEGPFLIRDDMIPLVPAPLHMLGQPEKSNGASEPSWKPVTLLTPSKEEEAILSDLGLVRLPVAAEQTNCSGLKEVTNQWITLPGLTAILRDELPSAAEIVAAGKLWKMEPRVGLKRDEVTRTAGEGALYSPRFVRLPRGVRLAVRVSGLPDETWQLPNLLPFGGEGRLADCCLGKEWTWPTPPVVQPNAAGRVPFTVTLLTPLMLPITESNIVSPPKAGDALLGLEPSRIVSACVGKSSAVGGWDSLRREPLPLRPVLPAGSTWFCEVDQDAWPSVRAQHGQHIGDKTSFGYGQIVLGQWPDKKP